MWAAEQCTALPWSMIGSWNASLVWFWDTFRLNVDADSVLVLLAHPTSLDRTRHPVVGIEITNISRSPWTDSPAALFPPNRWSRKDRRASFNFCWNTWKNSHCLHKKLDQVPRLHVNIFLSTPDSAQGLLHHVTFLCRIKDVGTFYPSRDSSPLKSHLFSL